MLIYILNFLSIPIYRKFVKDKKKLCFLVSLQLFLILALRNDILCVDYPGYFDGFNYIASLPFGDMVSRLHFMKIADLIYPYSFESGWVVFNWLIAFLGGNFHTLLVIHALICISSVGYFIYKNSDCPWLSFTIFVSFSYYVYCFGILRQMMMIAILLFSFDRIKNKKNMQAFLLFLLAFTIHRTAIMFFAVFIVANFVLTEKWFKLYLLFCIIIGITGPLYIPYLIRIAFSIMGKTSYISKITGITYNNMTLLLFLIAILIYLFAKDSIFKNKTRDNLLFSVYNISLVLSIASMYSDIFGRPNQMFYIMMIALIPNVIEMQNSTELNIFRIETWFSKFCRIVCNIVTKILEFVDSKIISKITKKENVFGISKFINKPDNEKLCLIGKFSVYVLMFTFMVVSLHGDEILVPYRFFFQK